MISGKTGLLGLIGYPVSHSLSPKLYNELFKKYGMDLVYLPLSMPDPENLKPVVKALKALDFRGFNVTMPYKKSIIEFLDVLDGSAEDAGSVNTVLLQKGKLIGYNTDGKGLTEFLVQEAEVPLNRIKALVIGAGGAAISAVVSLLLNNAGKVVMFNRTEEKAYLAVEHIKSRFPGAGLEVMPPVDMERSVADFGVIINATPCGSGELKKILPVPEEALRKITPGTVAVDMVYEPEETLFLKRAGQAGARCFNGTGMLAFQAVMNFEIWTGKKPDLESIYKVISG